MRFTRTCTAINSAQQHEEAASFLYRARGHHDPTTDRPDQTTHKGTRSEGEGNRGDHLSDSTHERTQKAKAAAKTEATATRPALKLAPDEGAAVGVVMLYWYVPKSAGLKSVVQLVS